MVAAVLAVKWLQSSGPTSLTRPEKSTGGNNSNLLCSLLTSKWPSTAANCASRSVVRMP